MRHLHIIPCLVVLCGCATTSFAPPAVDMTNRLEARHHQTFVGAVCTPERELRNRAGAQTPSNYRPVGGGVEGALALINNYVLTYRCQRDRAAEGRQFFEVPAFLGVAGAATAAALGAGPTVAIIAGSASATLDHTKQYYAPRAKAEVLSSGLQAILCIQTEAVGVNPFVLQAVSDAQDVASGTVTDNQIKQEKAAVAAGQTVELAAVPSASISVSYGRQYYDMVRAALFSVEQIVAQRLSASGTPFDAAGVIAEIEKLSKKQQEEATASPDAATTDANKKGGGKSVAETKEAKEETVGEDVKKGAKALTSQLDRDAQNQLSALDNRVVGRTVIKLDQLNTKLQKCVVSAKV